VWGGGATDCVEQVNYIVFILFLIHMYLLTSLMKSRVDQLAIENIDLYPLAIHDMVKEEMKADLWTKPKGYEQVHKPAA
jgi:hypothetical protein